MNDREQMALEILVALLQHPEMARMPDTYIANNAVKMADALRAQLHKDSTSSP